MTSIRKENLLIFDGACGTTLQTMDISASAWGACAGCNEYLNISAPKIVEQLHRSFLEAGAMVLETNTFGASRIVLAEYDLAKRVEEINHRAVEHARSAIDSQAHSYVVGSIGPTSKLPTLGHISVDDFYAAIFEQAEALVDAGVDGLILETCQDLLQVKTSLIACLDVLEQAGADIPLFISVTIEQQGTMLVGTDIAAVVAAIEPFPVFSLGLNCATGPADMESHIRYLSNNWPGRISCIPNQGLPEIRDGETAYPLGPEQFARQMEEFVHRYGVSIVGGCCGTSPSHIAALAESLQEVSCSRKSVIMKPATASLYQAVELAQEGLLLIGERANPTGSKEFKQYLLDDDFEGCLHIGLEQEARGAQILDLCVAYAGRDEQADLIRLAAMFARSIRCPLSIDSTNPTVIEACLKIYPGRCLINSINLEDGGKNLAKICRLAKRYGAAVVALTIDEEGMAKTAQRKIAIAQRIHKLAVERIGLRSHELLFDPLTFTVCSGDEAFKNAAIETLAAIKGIKKGVPGVFTILGISNISYGLPPPARRILNSVFLHEAVAVGLDGAIIDSAKIIPLTNIDPETRELCLDLIYNRQQNQGKSPLIRFIEKFQRLQGAEQEEADKDRGASIIPVEHLLHRKIISGDKQGLDDLLAMLLYRYPPIDIINQLLVPAMREVGELFGQGELLLPFVLQSAEVMKQSVSLLEPLMDKAEQGANTSILLATVAGDVHDIGKNLVDIIFSNNGYTVYNLGIKVPTETIIAKAREKQVDLIGLSGLLVKSAMVMEESIQQLQAAGITAPVLLGGAALTEKFVATACVPKYDQPVVYCRDAFTGLKAVREFEAGSLLATRYIAKVAKEGESVRQPNFEVDHSAPVPSFPFKGARILQQIDPEMLFCLLNEQVLFRARWGYKRAKMTAEEYERLLEGKVRPLLEEQKMMILNDNLLQPQAIYGYFPCYRDGDILRVEAEQKLYDFVFPRQRLAPHLCIADFFKTSQEGGDLAGFFVVTIGRAMDAKIHSLYEQDSYHHYHLLHGLSVELTEALAEYCHGVMRNKLGIGPDPNTLPVQKSRKQQGERYGFGYPACPNLEDQRLLFAILDPGQIGVNLTENCQMVPEQSTSALIAPHPQARYFSV